MSDVNATLAERGARYGSFAEHSKIAQALKDVMRATPGWARLAPDQKQSMEMFCDKQARILSGDPNYADSWHDIAGYAKLVDDRLSALKPSPVLASLVPEPKARRFCPAKP